MHADIRQVGIAKASHIDHITHCRTSYEIGDGVCPAFLAEDKEVIAKNTCQFVVPGQTNEDVITAISVKNVSALISL